MVDGELTVKRLQTHQGRVVLLPENPKFKPIEIQGEMSFSISGVVTTVLHSLS
jgi:DNA polymerase V